jgi:hypothetical protein
MRKGKFSQGKETINFGKQRIVRRRQLPAGVREIHAPANPTGIIRK